MNAIHEAILRQGVQAAWRGPAPSSPAEITQTYLEEDVMGLPRVQYPEEEPGTLDAVQLAADFAELQFESARADHLDLIRTWFSAVESGPVDSIGVTWNGGYDSAMKLDAAHRLSGEAALPGVTFYDVDNVGHDLNLVDARQVVIDVSVQYQMLFSQKQQLMVATMAAQSPEEFPEVPNGS